MRCERCGKAITDNERHECDMRSREQKLLDRRDYWAGAANSASEGTARLAEKMVEVLNRAIEGGRENVVGSVENGEGH